MSNVEATLQTLQSFDYSSHLSVSLVHYACDLDLLSPHRFLCFLFNKQNPLYSPVIMRDYGLVLLHRKKPIPLLILHRTITCE